MAQVIIYHNPRCSKSRQTLALLEEAGHDVTVIRYQEEPPSVEELGQFCRSLGRTPLQLTRVKEKRFAELGLSRGDRRSTREWLKILHENPVLIERPIVVCGKRVALGRPPEAVLEIL